MNVEAEDEGMLVRLPVKALWEIALIVVQLYVVVDKPDTKKSIQSEKR
jgi:hypothetical protein